MVDAVVGLVEKLQKVRSLCYSCRVSTIRTTGRHKNSGVVYICTSRVLTSWLPRISAKQTCLVAGVHKMTSPKDIGVAQL